MVIGLLLRGEVSGHRRRSLSIARSLDMNSDMYAAIGNGIHVARPEWMINVFLFGTQVLTDQVCCSLLQSVHQLFQPVYPFSQLVIIVFCGF